MNIVEALLRAKKARLKMAEGYYLNSDMQIEASLLRKEITALENALALDEDHSDTDAMDEICAVMDGKNWSSETLDAIAEIVRDTGRIIGD